MILTSSEADPEVLRAARDGVLISDDVAQTIASWYRSPASKDEQVTRLSHGLDFDPGALLTRIDELSKGDWQPADQAGPALSALREWVLTRVPHVEIITVEATPEEWTTWCEYGIPDDRQGREVLLISDRQDDLGDWVYPGEEKYPADTSAYEVDPDDDGIWLPATAVDTAVDVLNGGGARFWAQEYHPAGAPRDPFGPAGQYVAHYEHPATSDVEHRTARLVGFSTEDQAAVYRAWKRP